MIPRLADLREPPVVGRWYLVPVLRSTQWCEVTSDWPVIGPLHTDREFFNFTSAHYHIDARFLTARQASVGMRFYYSARGRIDYATGALPLSDSHIQTLPRGRPGLMKRKCTLATYSTPYGDREPVLQLRAKYGETAQPIRKPDGRLLCPHRKVDLSSFVPDVDGLVTCPLHGLRVCVEHNGLPA